MATHAEYQQAKTDYKYLVAHHKADIYDITGGYIDGEQYKKLLDNPSKSNAYRHFVDMITYSASNGFDIYAHNEGGSPDFDDKRTVGIYRKYNCSYEVSEKWGVDING